MRLRTGLMLALSYVLLLATLSLGVPLALSLRDRVNTEVRSQARAQADVVAATAADIMQPPRTAELGSLAGSAAASVRGRVILVDARGVVLADSAGSGALGTSYRSRPEVAAALAGRPTQEQRASRTLHEELLATAAPILRHGLPVGAVRVTQSVAAVARAVNRTIAELALLAGVVLVLGLLAGALIAAQVARPLGRLEATARRVAGGDLEARAPAEGSVEQQSLARSFNDMTARLARLLRSQQDFVADASHQLRTPLTGLRLRLEEAEAGGVPSAAAAHLRAGEDEVDRLDLILDELLVLSRAGERELPGEPLDLGDAVRRVAERWAPAATEAGLELDVAPSERPSTVWCARPDLDRAVDVLVENALRYAPPGSVVRVSGHSGRIEVRDHGPGLALGEEEAVFERFHRGRAGRAGPRGTGLGLAIARALARGWGGEATLANHPDGGAIAVLELPRSTSPRPRNLARSLPDAG